VIAFKYNLIDGYTGFRFCLVVKNDLGRIGYVSERGNKLLSCFRIEQAPTFVTSFILRKLYNKPALAERQAVQEGLVALLGSLNYRTYKLNSMRELNKIYLVVKKLPQDDIEALTEYSEDYIRQKEDEEEESTFEFTVKKQTKKSSPAKKAYTIKKGKKK
jgi:hypothetical protein